MHFVYIVGRGSRWQDNELRYSLRSLENFAGDFDVWIVGHCPPWANNVNHFPCVDKGTNPILNVSLKILGALEDLPEEFVLMNDDFYIMKPVHEIPVVHAGPMRAALGHPSKGLYMRAFRQTYTALRELRVLEPLRFDCHIPFPMTKSGLKELTVAWPSGRFLLKTVYGNLIHKSGSLVFPSHDIKAALPRQGAIFWSSETTLTPIAKQVLARAFPHPSIYEKS